MSILVPTIRLPRFEITNCAVTTKKLSGDGGIVRSQPSKIVGTRIQATFRLYIIPAERAVLRQRLSTATITSGGVEIGLAYLTSVVEDPPHPVFASGPDIIADGPGAFSLVFQIEVVDELSLGDSIAASTTIHLVDAPRSS